MRLFAGLRPNMAANCWWSFGLNSLQPCGSLAQSGCLYFHSSCKIESLIQIRIFCLNVQVSWKNEGFFITKKPASRPFIPPVAVACSKVIGSQLKRPVRGSMRRSSLKFCGTIIGSKRKQLRTRLINIFKLYDSKWNNETYCLRHWNLGIIWLFRTPRHSHRRPLVDCKLSRKIHTPCM